MFPVAPPVEGQDWLTTPPVPWSSLKGRVVVVLFWSFGCEASLLALRDLETMTEVWRESGADDDVVAIAVHTPRFPFEDDPAAVRNAVLRHRVEQIVVHDPQYLTWNRYNPEGWPAAAVINQKGRVVGIGSGATSLEQVSEAVATELAIGDGKSDRRSGDSRSGSLPHPTLPVRQSVADSTLCFPSGVAVTASGRVVVSDSGNDRLIIGDLDSDLRTFRPTIEITDIDDPAAVASASDSIIYVIERGTGSVMQVDLDHGTLDVLADDELEAPTALAVDRDGSLVVADAGREQLVRITGDGEGNVLIGTIAGSGMSGCADGPARRAELAQPVGMARTDSGMAFCDAASSNLRILTDGGEVVTTTGNDFYDWGLVDGPARKARLQRPTGVCAMPDGSLIIADSGNNRLRRLADRKLTTLGLSGLNHPTAVARLSADQVLVADTGHHRLVVADAKRKTGWPLAVYPAVMTSVWEPTSEVS